MHRIYSYMPGIHAFCLNKHAVCDGRLCVCRTTWSKETNEHGGAHKGACLLAYDTPASSPKTTVTEKSYTEHLVVQSIIPGAECRVQRGDTKSLVISMRAFIHTSAVTSSTSPRTEDAKATTARAHRFTSDRPMATLDVRPVSKALSVWCPVFGVRCENQIFGVPQRYQAFLCRNILGRTLPVNLAPAPPPPYYASHNDFGEQTRPI